MFRVFFVMTSLVVVVLLGCYLAAAIWMDYLRNPALDYRGVDEMYFPEQNWSEDDRQWFYHTTQGTEAVPLKWLLALEQPKLLGWGAAPPFLDNDYLGGLGLLPNPNRLHNPHGLPVGLAVDDNFVEYNPRFDIKSKDQRYMVGMTCAFCHTGQLHYRGIAVRVDGGASLTDVDGFQTELGLALGLTNYLPFRFNRFAEKVLGPNHDRKSRSELKADLSTVIDKLRSVQRMNSYYPTKEGPGRLDALARIGNFVFGWDMDDEENLRVGDAPVSLPHIWDTGWFDWVQYNGSIRQPMMRNISEALGVYASVNLDSREEMLESSVPIDKLHEMEMRLFGEEPYTGLRSPDWPHQVFGPINRKSAALGRTLYRQHCQRCHLPPVESPHEFWAEANWEGPDLEKGLGKSFLRTTMVAVECDPETVARQECIGTDPNLVNNWAERTAVAKQLGFASDVGAGVGLQQISRAIAKKYYDDHGFSEEERFAWDGYRPDTVRAPIAYKARPLNGVWATAPFLHNGSVPNLYELLLPAEERSTTFYVGSREFDPKLVGLSTKRVPGAFLFDTRKRGNSNAGHEFKGATLGNGVIGPELTDQERFAIMEYIKTLTGRPAPRPASDPPAPTETLGEVTSES